MALTPLILSLELARRLELTEAGVAANAAATLLNLRGDSGAACERVGGGFAVYCGANSPLTQAVGMGLAGPVSAEDLRRLESFYGSRGEAVRVETCPLGDASLIEHFGKNGYRVTEFTNVMARPSSDAGHALRQSSPQDGVTVERLGAERADQWAATVADGFADHPPSVPEIVECMKAIALSPNVECYLGRVNGEAAGAGAFFFSEKVAILFAASTLRGFRSRGVQTALLQARLQRSSELGSELAMCLAAPGSASQRNVMRREFQTLYTPVKFERDHGASENQ